MDLVKDSIVDSFQIDNRTIFFVDVGSSIGKEDAIRMVSNCLEKKNMNTTLKDLRSIIDRLIEGLDAYDVLEKSSLGEARSISCLVNAVNEKLTYVSLKMKQMEELEKKEE